VTVTISNPPTPGVTGTFFLPRDYSLHPISQPCGNRGRAFVATQRIALTQGGDAHVPCIYFMPRAGASPPCVPADFPNQGVRRSDRHYFPTPSKFS